MKLLPHLDLSPRVDRDIEDCLAFIRRQPWGKPDDRWRDILRGVQKVLQAPLAFPVKVRRPETGRELRRYGTAQFVIVYSYTAPNEKRPAGEVSIRAIRHRRVQDVFMGVREPTVPYGTYIAA